MMELCKPLIYLTRVWFAGFVLLLANTADSNLVTSNCIGLQQLVSGLGAMFDDYDKRIECHWLLVL